MKYLYTLLVAFLFINSGVAQVIPSPKEMILSPTGNAVFEELNYQTTDPKIVEILGIFGEELNSFAVHKKWIKQSKSKVNLVIDIKKMMSKDSYELNISDQITILAGSYQALSYATTTLIQLATISDGKLNFPKIRISDKPEHQYRALMIDLGRKWHDQGTLESIIKICRYYKIPYLQLHLSDDQMFTFKSAIYPELSSQNNYYTKQQLRELVKFADQRGVTLIPELDLPGHSTIMRKTMPHVFGEESLSVINFTEEKTMSAVKALMTEIADVFSSSPYFHIGADEADFSKLANLPKAKEIMAKKGYDSVHDLFLEYIVTINNHVKTLGKRTVIWESFQGNGSAHVKIPNDILVIAWETLYQRPDSLLKNGYEIINASWKPLYVTPRQRWSPQYMYDNWNLERWANWWDAAPSFHPIQLPKHAAILGAQFCSWEMSDYMEVPELLARMPVFSEKLWSNEVRSSYADFSTNAAAQSSKIKKLLFPATLEVNGTIPSIYPEIEYVETDFLKTVAIKAKPLEPKNYITYTIDGTVPSARSKRLSDGVEIANTTDFRAAVFNSLNEVIGYYHNEFKKVDLYFKVEGAYQYPEDVNVAGNLVILIKDPVNLKIYVPSEGDHIEYRIKGAGSGYTDYDKRGITLDKECHIEARIKGGSAKSSITMLVKKH